MRNRPIWHRAIVISAGVIANLIFAYFLLVVQINVVGIPKVSPGVAIPQIINPQESVAAKAGIEAGDIVLAVNQNTLGSSSESLAQFRDTVQNSPEVPLRITLQRGDKKITLEVTPEKTVEGEGKIGVVLSPNVEVIRSKGILQSLTMAAGAFVNIVLLTVQGFWQLISNFSENIGQVAGPVKIVEYGASIAKDNLSNLYQFAALISINLAIINILPLPALDGGQLLFLVLEGMRGKPLPDGIQNNIMQTGLFLLLGLGVFLIVRDTLTLSVFQ
jgi:RIP metalloprotease RseP